MERLLLNLYIMFSKFFINRPIFATVLALLIVVAGLVTLNILPVAQFPEITPPTVQVSAVYPGANAETVAQTVGIPIEQQVNGVDGMLYMSSNSSSSGAYSLTITFAVGTDIDMATVQVQNRVSIAQSSLPEPVVVQGIIRCASGSIRRLCVYGIFHRSKSINPSSRRMWKYLPDISVSLSDRIIIMLFSIR